MAIALVGAADRPGMVPLSPPPPGWTRVRPDFIRSPLEENAEGTKAMSIFAPGTVWLQGPFGRALHREDGAWTRSDGARRVHEALWGASPSDLWSVGEVVEHWDGKAWTKLEDLPRGARLHAIHGSGPRNIWAVGSMVRRFDGKRWLTVPWDGKPLEAVWTSGSRDVWASSPDGPVHFDGRAWTLRAPEGDEFAQAKQWAGGRAPIRAFAGTGPDDVWACAGRVWHWDGSRWSLMPDSGPFPLEVESLSTYRRKEVWAAARGKLLRWDGGSWREEAVGESVALVSVSPEAGIWVANSSGTVLHRDLAESDRKTRERLRGFERFGPGGVAGQAPGGRDLGAVFTPGGEALFVGGSDGRVSRYDGARWTIDELVAPPVGLRNVAGLWGASAGDAWAVGEKIAHWNGMCWSLVSPEPHAKRPLDVMLYAISGTGSGDVWAVGRQGAVLHFDGKAWSWAAPIEPEGSGREPDHRAVFARAPDDVWIAGDEAVVRHWDGGAWTSWKVGENWNSAIWASGPDDAWVAGRGGVFHYDGQEWHKLKSDLGEMSGVWGRARDDVWFVGEFQVAHFDGDGLLRVQTDLPGLRTIAGRGDALYAVGRGGLIARLPRPATVKPASGNRR